MNRKQLKQKSLSIFNQKTEVVVPNIIYQLIGTVVSIVSIISIPFGSTGTIISTAILIMYTLSYPQIVKMHMDARNDRPIEIIDYDDFIRCLKILLIRSIYFLPSLIYYIGTIMVSLSLTVIISIKFSIFVTELETILTIEIIDLFMTESFLINGIVLTVIGLPIMKYIKSKYSLIYFMMLDYRYDKLNALQIIEESKKLIKGHKMEIFVLEFSFIGWKLIAYIAAIIPGAGSIVNVVGGSAVRSYVLLSKIEFYYELTKNIKK